MRNPYTLLVAVALVGAGDRRRRQQGDARAVRQGDHAAADGRARRGGAARAHQDHRPVQHQGEERHRRGAASWSTITAARCRSDRDALETLPGVGRKTANVVLNTAFGAADASRSTRTSSASPTAPASPRARPSLEVELKLEKVTPEPFLVGAHHWLILHGRYICKARTPECWRCPVVDLCAYKPKTPAA